MNSINYYLFFSIIISILVYSLWVSRKISLNTQSFTDYFLSGRSLKVFSLTLTLIATQLGGGAIIGNGEAAFEYGWWALCYSLGLSLGFVVLSVGVGAKLREHNISTLPELFSKVYGSSQLQWIAACLSILSLFLTLMAIGVAARKTLVTLGVDSSAIFLLFWLIMLSYTVWGGLSAVVKTDVVQIIYIIFALFYVVFHVFLSHPDPWVCVTPHALSSLPENMPWSEWIVMPMMFVIIGQDMSQRCFAAVSSRAVSLATFGSAISLLVLSAVPTYIGTLAASSGFASPHGGGSILMMFVGQVTNPYTAAVFAAAILMAILSTADSLLCSISLNVSKDFLFKFLPSFSQDMRVSRIITLVIGFSALVLSIFFDAVIPMMVFAYKISIYTLFVPIITATLMKNSYKESVYGSMVSGVAFFILSQNIEIPFFDLISLIGNSIVFWVIHIFLRSAALKRSEHH